MNKAWEGFTLGKWSNDEVNTRDFIQRNYTPYEGDIIWTNSGRYNFIGPTKAKVSLVWLITTKR